MKPKRHIVSKILVYHLNDSPRLPLCCDVALKPTTMTLACPLPKHYSSSSKQSEESQETIANGERYRDVCHDCDVGLYIAVTMHEFEPVHFSVMTYICTCMWQCHIFYYYIYCSDSTRTWTCTFQSQYIHVIRYSAVSMHTRKRTAGNNPLWHFINNIKTLWFNHVIITSNDDVTRTQHYIPGVIKTTINYSNNSL
jgi:hypothetical protein